MNRDPILNEVRSIREAIAKEHDYDVAAIFDMFRRNAESSTHAHVNLAASTTPDIRRAAQLGGAADEGLPRR
jgi:hypothetical protein